MKIRYLKQIPVVTDELCTGCGRCVEACELGILEVVEGVAVLRWAERCSSQGACLGACEEAALRMEWVEMEGERTYGRWVSGGRAWPGRLRGQPAWNPPRRLEGALGQ